MATTEIDRKEGAAVPLSRCDLGRGLLPYTKWRLDPSSRLATIDMGRKLGAVLLWGGGPGFPSSTMWPGPRPTGVPSFILICPTVWPQCTNVTDRTGQTDRQRSNDTRRTVLQTVAEKSYGPTQVRVGLPYDCRKLRDQHDRIGPQIVQL